MVCFVIPIHTAKGQGGKEDAVRRSGSRNHTALGSRCAPGHHEECVDKTNDNCNEGKLLS